MKSTSDLYKLVRLATLCLLTVAVLGCTNRVKDASELASIAEQQFAAGELNNARNNIQKAIATRDDVSSYYILLGQVEVQAQQPISAFNAFSLALDLEADNVQVLQSIADLGLQTGRVKEAKEAAERILILVQNSPNALLVKGFIAVDEGQLDQAKSLVKAIFEIDPDNEGGAILAARIDALQGRSSEALVKIDSAIERIGETAALNATRLEIYRLGAQPDRMLATFPAILKEVGINSEYKLDQINLLYKIGRVNEAQAASFELLQSNQTNAIQVGKLLELWAEYSPLSISRSQLVSISQGGSDVNNEALIRHFLFVKDLNALRQLTPILRKNDRPETQALLARILLAKGNASSAYEMASRVLETDERNQDALIVRYDQMMTRRQYDQALAAGNVLVSDSPQSPLGWVLLGNAFATQGNQLRARQTFEQGLDALPQSRLLAGEYKKLLQRWGDTKRIVSVDKDVALASPSSTKSWAAYSKSCQEYGDNFCQKSAADGLARSKANFRIDDLPGTPRKRGLFARITPEKICASTGGICTDN